MNRFGRDVRIAINAVSQIQTIGAGFVQTAPIGIVHIDNRAKTFELLRITRHFGKQLRFGLEVIFHVGVKIQMILREIGKNARIKGATGHAV